MGFHRFYEMIRKAKLTDIKNIGSLIKIGAKSGQVLLRSKKEIKDVIESFFVAEENNKIVGCCSLEKYSLKLAEIRSLVVLKEFRNKGIGTKLIKRCIKEAKVADIYEILSITDKIIFFKKFGFRNTLNNQWPLFLRLRDRYNGDNR